MAKNKAQLEKEYQDALKVSSSMVSGLTKLIEANTGATKKKTSAEKGYQKSLKQMLADSDKAASIQDRIAAIESEKASISKRYFGKNKQIGDIIQDTLSKEKERLTTIGKVDDKAQELSDTMGSSLDDFHSSLGSIPVLGGLLQKVTAGPLEGMKNAISDSAKSFVTGFADAAKGGKAGIMGFVKSSIGGFRAMGIAMLTGPQAIIFGLLAIVALGIKAFANMESAAKAFRDETGLLNSQTQQMQTNINSVYMETVGLGASMEDVAKAASDFTNEFGGIEQPMASTMKSMTVLSKNFGVSTQDAAKLNKAFQNMGGLSEEVAQANLESLTSLAAQEGVAPSKVMADIAESAEEANGFFRGNVEAMGAAAINAAKLGTSLKKALEVSKGLLNYQDSIGGEMEASAILGTNLNFSQSRYLAAQGDVVGAQASMVEQLRNQVDLQNLSIFEQEALEKATGMTVAEMQNMARIQELGLSTEGERGKLLQKALKNGMDISKMSKEEINAATDKLALEQERQGRLESMGNQLKGIGQSLLQAFLPIGELLIGAISFVMPLVKGIFGTVSVAIKNLIKAFDPIKTIFNDIFGGEGGEAVDGIKKAFEVIGNILGGVITVGINIFANAIKAVSNIISGVYDIFKGLMSGNFDQVKEGLFSLGEGILRFFAAIPMALLDTFGNVFTAIRESLSGMFTGLKEKILNILPNWALKLLGKSGGAESQEAAMETKVNDAVIGPSGDVISTSPQDYLIATQDPQSLAGGGIPSMEGVIAELKELKAAFVSNKDVYIDNEKITSRITKTQEKSNINQFGLMGA